MAKPLVPYAQTASVDDAFEDVPAAQPPQRGAPFVEAGKPIQSDAFHDMPELVSEGLPKGLIGRRGPKTGRVYVFKVDTPIDVQLQTMAEPETTGIPTQTEAGVLSRHGTGEPDPFEGTWQSHVSGVKRGVAGMLGLPALLGESLQDDTEPPKTDTLKHMIWEGKQKAHASGDRTLDEKIGAAITNLFPSSVDIRKKWASEQSPEIVPITTLGREVSKAGEGAVGGPGGMAAAAAGQGVRELGGPEWAATGTELALPFAGGFTRLATGGLTKLASKIPASKAAQMMEHAAKGMTDEEVLLAQKAMKEARDEGNQLTFSEAANKVTNGRMQDLIALQRVIEQSPGGSEILNKVMTKRLDAAMRMAKEKTYDIAGAPLTGPEKLALPGKLAGRAQEAGGRTATGVTEAVAPHYQQAMLSKLPQEQQNAWAALAQRPAVRQAWAKTKRAAANRGQPVEDWFKVDDNGNIAVTGVPTVQQIDDMKKALDNAITSKVTPAGQKLVDDTGLRQARADLVHLGDQIPAYGQGRYAYQELTQAPEYQGPKSVMERIGETGGTPEEQFQRQIKQILPDAPLITDADSARYVIRQLQGGRRVDVTRKVTQREVPKYVLDTPEAHALADQFRTTPDHLLDMANSDDALLAELTRLRDKVEARLGTKSARERARIEGEADMPGEERTIVGPLKQRPLKPEARQAIGTYIGGLMDDMAKAYKTKPVPQDAGAAFKAAIAGNPKQAEILKAVIEEVGGPQAWDGFNRMLDIFEAQGWRQAPGSQTTFNQMIRNMMEQPRFGVSTADLPALGAAAGGNISPLVMRGLKGLEESGKTKRAVSTAQDLANMMLDENNVDKWRKLATMLPYSPGAARLAAELMGVAGPGAEIAGRAERPDTSEFDRRYLPQR